MPEHVENPSAAHTAPAVGFRRRTLRRVRIYDAIAGAVINAGGPLIVAAVLGICVYLASVVVPLFIRGETVARSIPDPRVPSAVAQRFVQPDEHGTSLLLFDEQGVVRLVESATGQVAAEESVVPDGRTITAFCRAPRQGHVAIGYDDGSVQVGRLTCEAQFLLDEGSEQELSDLPIGASRIFGGAVVQRTILGQLRSVRPVVDLPAPSPLAGGSGPVRLIGYSVTASNEYLAAMREDGSLAFNTVRKITPLGGGRPRLRLAAHSIAGALPSGESALPWRLFVTGDGSSLLLIWEDGRCRRFDTRDPDAATLAEEVRLVPPGRRVTAASLLVGDKTLVVGDDAGGLSGWFCARDPAAATPDGLRFVRAHECDPMPGAIVSIGASERDRNFIVADATGRVSVRNMTSGSTVVNVDASGGGAVAHAALFPKLDGLVTLSRLGACRLWGLDPGHPEATLRSLFGRVWYEGEGEPAHVYQSSSGDDAAEAKYGLTPLIWGTIKATVYTMLLAVPVAVLAAICTSEFLGRRTRMALKPAIEMMASLPSVVMGFIAAMILAPAVYEHLPGVLVMFVAIPLGVLTAAHLWQLIPGHVTARWPGWVGGCAAAGVTLLAGVGAIASGRAVEHLMFRPGETDLLVLAGSYEPVPRSEWPAWVGARRAVTDAEARALRREGLAFREGGVVRAVGSIDAPDVRERIAHAALDRPDFKAWSNSVYGGALPGWQILLFPVALLVVLPMSARHAGAWLRGIEFASTPMGAATLELAKLLVSVLAAATAAGLGAGALTALGLDPRDSILGTVEQRNTLVVAMAMSVAVIPIVYTICEDAISSVPAHLRAASLAAGATRWQTATRVVLPVAMSGVFSATMIGFGRAVGETMIVVMATGGTPIMSASIFDGMRTLSANIATELPEAPPEGTHYRVLFLCGLVLFILTFAVNTVAEVVRIRFRARSQAL